MLLNAIYGNGWTVDPRFELSGYFHFLDGVYRVDEHLILHGVNSVVNFHRLLSIVILSFNRKGDLESNIPLILQFSEAADWEVVVVDNGSTDGSVEFLKSSASGRSNVHLILNSGNLGVAGGRNAGWEKSSGDFILNIDDDAFVDFDGICSMLQFMLDHPEVGVISPKIIHRITLASQCDHGSVPVEISNFHGACHLVRRSVYSAVGGIDDLCSFGGEELDYSIRVRNAGFNVLYAPVAVAVHNNFHRIGSEGVWRRRQWVFNYTRVLFKNFPVSMAAVYSSRLLVSHIFSAIKARMVVSGLSLLLSCWRGVFSGFKARSVASKQVCEFYRNPELRPDLGNVSIARKVYWKYSNGYW